MIVYYRVKHSTPTTNLSKKGIILLDNELFILRMLVIDGAVFSKISELYGHGYNTLSIFDIYAVLHKDFPGLQIKTFCCAREKGGITFIIDQQNGNCLYVAFTLQNYLSYYIDPNLSVLMEIPEVVPHQAPKSNAFSFEHI
jgi:hypothetical protein